MKTYQGLPNVAELVALTHSDDTFGYVDSVKNLLDDRVYLFSGSQDSVVDSKVMHSLQDYYNSFVSPSNIVADFSVSAEHCFPTLAYGEACGTLSSPYIGKCGFDGAEAAFKTLYGQNLNAKTAMVSANFKSFDQTPYFSGTQTSLGDVGYIYVPQSCANGATCHLHVSFHGCLQTLDDIGNDYAAKIGMNEWAESNNIIVLYPYAKKSTTLPTNPNG